MPYKPLPPQSLLREWFNYNPKTGMFLYRNPAALDRPGRPRKSGAGVSYVAHTPHGPFPANRLIWKWWYGVDPDGHVHTKDRRPAQTLANTNHNRKLTNLCIR